MFHAVKFFVSPREHTMYLGDAMTGPKSIRSLERGLYVLQALQEQPISSLHDVHRFTGIPEADLATHPAHTRAGGRCLAALG